MLLAKLQKLQFTKNMTADILLYDILNGQNKCFCW